MAAGSARSLRGMAGRLHPAVQAKVRRLAAPVSRAPGAGLLSVIVPMYNVAPYLDRCLASLVAQTYGQLEIILVDDGSTDGTAAIAAGYARRDRRMKLLTLPHGGNGRARNRGIEAATGKYLAFADADDVVPAGAYATMVENLDRTGSDFCVGSYGRIRGSKRTPVRLSDRIHAQPHAGIDLAQAPDVIDDVFLWNKVFVRTFWNASVGPIPEDIRYEDQETTARAYLRADSFDILTPVVYWWRIREDGSSITQAKYLLEDLRDRLLVAGDVTELFSAEGSEPVLAHWHCRLLGRDLIPYIEQAPDASEAFWELLRNGLQELYAAGQPYLSGIDPQSRVLLHLAAGGHREDLRRAVVDRINNGTASPLTFDGGRIVASPPFLAVVETAVPADLLEVLPGQLELVAVLEEPRPSAAGTYTVSGHAYIRHVDLRVHPVDLSVQAVAGGACTNIAVQRWSNPEIDVISDDRNCSYANSAFSLKLEAALPAELTVCAEIAGHTVERTIQLPVPAKPDRLLPGSGPAVTALAALSREGVDELVIDVAGAPAGASFALVTARFRLPAKISVLADKTVLRVPLATDRWGRALPAPPSGAYTLRWRRDGAETGLGDPAVPVAEGTSRSFSSTLLCAVRIRGLRTAAGAMAVSIGGPLAENETGTFHQYRLRREAFGPGASPAPAPGIFFESFGGKSCTDSPRAISDYLADSGFDEPLYWSVADRSVPIPDYAVPLLHGSAEWYEKLAATGRLVNNNNFPWYFRKSPDQFYLQTWHGTPLKKIGLDVPQNMLSLSYRDLMEREAQWWDLLLAQNGFAAATLPPALGYTGKVLTSGYPRNDALFNPRTRERIRELLGIDPGQNVLLYAPTWRDAVRDGAGRSDWTSFFDVAGASRRLGPGYTFLIRGHHNVAGQRRVEEHPQALDVTDYPEINDLYLASDALITDYSSAMFDYAVTGRPVFILAADLEEFWRSRGLYRHPGNIVPERSYADSDSLVRALSEWFVPAAQHRRRRAAGTATNSFAAEYAPQDDGDAAARAAQAFLALGPAPYSLQSSRGDRHD